MKTNVTNVSVCTETKLTECQQKSQPLRFSFFGRPSALALSGTVPL